MNHINLNRMLTKSWILLAISFIFNIYAQYPGPVGTPGTTAMYKDSSAFVNWASACYVTRGYQDISNPSLGYTTFGADTNGTKKAGVNGYVSLGDGGTAVLTFPYPIKNGPGPDFAVFENAFNDTFLELAFVEVSSDGVNFYRFPAVSLTQTVTQIGPFDNSGDATKLHNLAGKYRVNYGTPFDLNDLSGNPGLDVNNITHVKIIDVVGCIQAPYATYDAAGRPVNDPWPTAFNSGGFDLDAVGVIHQNVQGIKEENNLSTTVWIYPQPANDFVEVYGVEDNAAKIRMLNNQGANVFESNTGGRIDVSELARGIYFLEIQTKKGAAIRKKLVLQ